MEKTLKVNNKLMANIDTDVFAIGYMSIKDDTEIHFGLSFLIFHLTYTYIRKPRKQKLIEAIIETATTVSFKDKQYRTYLPYEYPIDLERRKHIYTRNGEGKFTAHDDYVVIDQYDKVMIAENKEKLGTRHFVERKYNIWLYPEGTKVRGFIRNGKFVIVS